MSNAQLQNLKKQLEQGNLRLDKATLDPQRLAEQLQQAFSGELVELQQVQQPITPENDYLHFKTVAPSLLGVIQQAVEGIFFLHNGELEFLLTAQLPPAWDFSWGYPDLPDYTNARFTRNQPSFFNDMRFDGAMKILFSSFDFQQDLAPVPKSYLTRLDSTLDSTKIHPGLNFISQLNLEETLFPSILTEFANITDISLPFHGHLQDKSTHQEIWLEIDIGFNKTFEDIFTVDVSSLALYTSTSLYAFNTKSGMILLGDIAVGNSQPKNMELIWPIGSTRFILQNAEPISLPSFDTFNNLLSGHLPKDSSAFPVPEHKLNDLYIRELSLHLSLSPVSVTYILLSIGPAETWSHDLLGEALTIEDMLLRWEVTPNADPAIRFYMLGAFYVGGGLVNVGAEFPDFEFYGELGLYQTIALDQVFKKILPAAPLPQTSVLDLALSANVKQNLYSFELDMASDWEIEVGPASIMPLKHLRVSLEKNPGGAFATIDSVITISGVDLILFATNVGESAAGWTFEGSTRPGQAIPIGHLIADLADLFGEISLPASLESLIIENLGISFNTDTKDFYFTCESIFEIEEQVVDITLSINITKQDNSYNKHFEGHITIGDLQFNLIFSKDNTSKTFLATYNNPNGDSLKIKTLVADVSDDIATYIPATLEITLKDALFIYSKNQTQSNFLFGLNLSSQINLSNLPLVGKQFPPEQTISVDDLQFLIASQNLNTKQADNFNNLIPEKITKLPLKATGNNTNVTAVKKGLNVSANLQFGDTTQILALPITSESQPTTPTPTPSSTPVTTLPPTSETDNTKWYALKKHLGPLYFGRIGIQYQDAILWFLLDASISAAGLTLNLDGLSVGSPISKFEPKFNLRGIGIKYESQGAVSIEGAFLRTTINGRDEYSGSAIVKTETFTISAIGSYTTTEQGHPSLFIYGILDKPIGGPAFFFVTGIALGFAYNRSLILPTLDQIPQFPLVKAALNGAKANPGGLIAIQRELQPYIPPKVGQVVLAAGVKFTSFKIIESFVLLVVTFGDKFSLELLGISTLISPSTLPPNKSPLAQVRLGILARFVPSEGTLKVDGKILPDSYLFDRDCRLSGGFAFYSWFSGEYEGDFVLTVGGYHPRFQVPAHYPRVDPIALNWRISNNLSVKGSLYFALTASAIMAGGRLEAVWHSGNIKAWFIAYAHFLVAWQPYAYDAQIGIRLGASYTFNINLLFTRIRKTISIEVGADLHIWGPKFSGTATIHLYIVSFTVRFGSRSQKKPPSLKWEEFKKSFLPAQEEVCTIAVESGLLRKVEAEEIFIVNPQEFLITTSSVIPIKDVEAGQTLIKQQTESGVRPQTTTFGIAPMEIKSNNFNASEYSISIKKNEQEVGEHFECTPIAKNIPTALWGESNSNDPNRTRFINNVLSGYKIKPANPPKPGKTQTIERKNLAYDTEKVDNAYQWNSFSTFSKSEETNEDTREKNIGESITSEDVKNARNSLLESLGLSATNIDLEEFETDKGIEQAFIIAPQLEAAMV